MRITHPHNKIPLQITANHKKKNSSQFLSELPKNHHIHHRLTAPTRLISPYNKAPKSHAYFVHTKLPITLNFYHTQHPPVQQQFMHRTPRGPSLTESIRALGPSL